jgi:hypothetical protein
LKKNWQTMENTYATELALAASRAAITFDDEVFRAGAFVLLPAAWGEGEPGLAVVVCEP